MPPPTIDGYRVIEIVGSGGMGDVYRAHDELLDREVAVKVVRAVDPVGPQHVRLLQEARAVARIQHPNVMAIYSVREVASRPVLVCEFLHGPSLAELPKPVPWRKVLELGLGLARGLAAAHRRGVLHRDIKPSNAILTNDGEVKLLDFGIAQLTDPTVPPDAPAADPASEPNWLGQPSSVHIARDSVAPSATTLVSSSRRDAEITPTCPASPASVLASDPVIGTPDYMPPELWFGARATERSDVYSLGALLFELCTGQPPTRNAPSPIPLGSPQYVHDPPPSIAVFGNAGLATIIDTCLASNPSDRYASGEDLRAALEELKYRVEAEHRRPHRSRPRRLRRPARRGGVRR